MAVDAYKCLLGCDDYQAMWMSNAVATQPCRCLSNTTAVGLWMHVGATTLYSLVQLQGTRVDRLERDSAQGM